MKRRWVRIVSLALILGLGVAAAALRVCGVATIKDAGYRQKIDHGVSDIAYQLVISANGEAAVPPDACIRLLAARFSAFPNAHYNIVTADSQGAVLYRLNGNFIPGNRIRLFKSGAQAILKDIDAGKTMVLNTDIISKGSANAFAYDPENEPPYTAAETLNGTIASLGGIVYLFLYDDAAETYLTVTYPTSIRAGGELLLKLSAGMLAAFWLGLALWVFLDARQLGQSGWKWGGWLLTLNVAGFTAYIVARSHGFGPGPCCANCNRPVDRAWVRCPFCGEKPEERVLP